MSERFNFKRKLTAAGLLLAGGLALSACGGSPVDYEGTGHRFTVLGTVSDSEKDGLVQIHEDDLKVVYATGKAEKWFAEGKAPGLFGDEFDFLQKYSQEPGGWFSCGNDKYVGQIIDENRDQIQPEDLKPGDVIRIEGRIRESRYYQSRGKSGSCTEENLAVYDVVTVIGDFAQ